MLPVDVHSKCERSTGFLQWVDTVFIDEEKVGGKGGGGVFVGTSSKIPRQ